MNQINHLSESKKKHSVLVWFNWLARTAKMCDLTVKNFAPKLWNDHPANLHHCGNVNTFKGLLKTHLFIKAYGD